MVSLAYLVESIVGRLDEEQVVFVSASWFNDNYDDLKSKIKIDDFEIVMKDTYHKVGLNK
ncbi:hypothetical protein GVN20_27920 [Runella sp. CRIBMP]|uniref:hypothetical protein n=1 Tax=Runella sp. CRIBMP TaxID=2683261 RepID=UPI001411B95A|nr:hypothetical protein [Runella sp. CRIBMP]NBB23211.1 hypothetical protein [Runella sp. CRIBMP]